MRAPGHGLVTSTGSGRLTSCFMTGLTDMTPNRGRPLARVFISGRGRTHLGAWSMEYGTWNLELRKDGRLPRRAGEQASEEARAAGCWRMRAQAGQSVFLTTHHASALSHHGARSRSSPPQYSPTRSGAPGRSRARTASRPPLDVFFLCLHVRAHSAVRRCAGRWCCQCDPRLGA